MPKTIDGKPVDEAKWDKAKKLAAKQGRTNDYKYIMGIYKKMMGLKDTENKSFEFLTDKIAWNTAETKTGKKYFVIGYISTKDIDIDDDLVTEKGMDSMLNQLRNKNIKIDVEHEVFRDNPNIIPVARIIEAHKDDKGIWIKAELNPASPKFSNVWDSIKTGFIDAFSIAFKAIKAVKKKIGDKTVRLLDDLELFNVAFTGNPVNPECLIHNVIIKSLDAIDDNPALKSILEEKTMEKQEVKDEEEQPKDEEKPAEEEEKKEEAPEEKTKEETKEDSDNSEELKALKAQIKSFDKKLEDLNKKHEAEMKALREEMNAPELKAKVEDTPKPKMPEMKGTLDLIGG